MKQLLSLLLVASCGFVLPGCDKDEAKPKEELITMSIGVNMVKFPTNSPTKGMAGLAKTEADARALRGTELEASATSIQTLHGQLALVYTAPSRRKGEKLWLYMTSSQPLTGDQEVYFYVKISSRPQFIFATPVNAFTLANGPIIQEIILE